MLIINQLFGYSKKFATFATGNKTTQIYNTIPNKPNSNGKITINHIHYYGQQCQNRKNQGSDR